LQKTRNSEYLKNSLSAPYGTLMIFSCTASSTREHDVVSRLESSAHAVWRRNQNVSRPECIEALDTECEIREKADHQNPQRPGALKETARNDPTSWMPCPMAWAEDSGRNECRYRTARGEVAKKDGGNGNPTHLQDAVDEEGAHDAEDGETAASRPAAAVVLALVPLPVRRHRQQPRRRRVRHGPSRPRSPPPLSLSPPH
jgi:hypothetical protein